MPQSVPRPVPADLAEEPQTNPGRPVDVEYLKRKLHQALLAAEKAREEGDARVAKAAAEGERRAKLTGLAWGAGLIALSLGLAFGGWFKVEAMAQEKAKQAAAEADAGTDRKLAPIATDIAVLKNDMGAVKTAVDKAAEQQAEMLKLLRRREPR